MDRRQAATLLGVAPDAPLREVRSAFRRLVRRHHPDLAGGDGDDARRLTEAYRVLRAPAPADPAAAERAPAASASDDTLVLDLPPDEAFDALLDAACTVGTVSYVDAEAGLLEVLVTFEDGRRASALVTLQGRATGTTDAFVTLEALGDEPAPAPAIVLAALLDGLG
jgi:hypothetical protein